jgi:hypothetical protein
VVVCVGLTVGRASVEVNPAGTELQLKVLVIPVRTPEPRVVFEPEQIERLSPAIASGNGFTVTITLLLLVHPVAVMVSVTV